MSLKRKAQSIVITLSDGTVCRFCGPAVVEPGETRTIKTIYFSETFDLPEDTFFEELHPAGKEN